MKELWRLSATETAAAVKSREVSAADVAAAALERMTSVNSSINAVVDVRPDEVLRRATVIDQAIARGEDVGPLAGVPITIKVNVDQEGCATTNGVQEQEGLIAERNSPLVDNLLQAGAVLIGRTNTPAFSLRWFTSNRLHGATKNPHNASLTPGGSSGGAAAAVASGIGAVAHGTDIAGSIRYPAYACGVHGLRPSPGRVPAFNASSAERDIGGQLMAVSGPLARSIADLELSFAAMAKRDPRDPWWVPAPLQGSSVAKRVGLCLDPGAMGTTDSVKQKLRESARHLEAAGWTVEELPDLPSIREVADLQVILWLADGYDAKLAAAERDGDVGALTVLRGHRDLARSTSITTFSHALTRRATLIRTWQLLLERYPVLLLPLSAEAPFPNDLDLQGPEAFQRVWRSQTTQIATPFLGLPGLSVFTGMDGDVPTGVQVISQRFREDLCLTAGTDLERGFGAPEICTPSR